MSLVPMMFSKWWEDLEHPHHVFDQHFGHGLHPEDLELSISPYHDLVSRPHILHRRLAHRRHPYDRSLALTQRSGGTSTVHTDKQKFNVSLDVQQFKPEEITVKVVGNNVIVEGKHEEQKDEHGWISRQFSRKYLVPEQCDIEKLTSSLSSDGVLAINAPRKDLPIEDKKERVIEIQHTGTPAIKDSANKSIDSQKEAASQTNKSPAQPRAAEKIVKAA
ncbi:protein lethal(2)essential for life-like [Leptopilina heterotoma]|uniref:protein lethal(2)essential for life-like n=1 Tax=Leptopilina heterotoma TaxID=63436 RepID=UPI001CA89FAD|nr:protein lethal(2)essential for life-like [Leptopilina heterotoma]